MKDLGQHVASLESELSPSFVERLVQELMLQRQAERRGIGALSLVMHLLGGVALYADEIAWAYARLKPALVDALEGVFSLRFLDGG